MIYLLALVSELQDIKHTKIARKTCQSGVFKKLAVEATAELIPLQLLLLDSDAVIGDVNVHFCIPHNPMNVLLSELTPHTHE